MKKKSTKTITLNLRQTISVAWVWQCEISPKYLPAWKSFNCTLVKERNPEKYINEYNDLINQLCSNVPSEQIVFNKPALRMFIYNSMFVFAPFNCRPGVKDEIKLNKTLKQLMPENINAAESLMEPAEEDKKEARQIIKNLLSIDKNGIADYTLAHCGAAFHYDFLRKLS